MKREIWSTITYLDNRMNLGVEGMEGLEESFAIVLVKPTMAIKWSQCDF